MLGSGYIKGSPFPVTVLRKFGTPVKTISGVIASTPCRDQHVQTVDQTFNSISQKLLTVTCTARAEVTPGHLEDKKCPFW